jgi:hypothetical protein
VQRFVSSSSIGRILGGALMPIALLWHSPVSAASIYYLSPHGSNAAQGSQDAPWKTFRFVIPRLKAGDALILLDGRYDSTTTGLPSINCVAGAHNGTSEHPITIGAQNERRAWLAGDGTQPALKIQNCAYWTVVGLYMRQVDNPIASGLNGHNVHVLNTNNVTLRRLLVYGNNRYWNTHAIIYESSSGGLVEECEVYFYHRHGISFGTGSSNNVARRNYVNSRDAADVCSGCNGDSSGQSSIKGDEGVTLAYPGSNNIAENNISVNNYAGYAVSALGTTVGNAAYGNVSLNNLYGFLVVARGIGLSNTPQDTVLLHNVVLGATYVGVYSRASKNTWIGNLTTIGSSKRSGLVADTSLLARGDGASSVFVTNTLSLSNKQYGFSVSVADLTDWTIDSSNAFGNSRDYVPAAGRKITRSSSIDPTLGACTLWIPDGSPMKRAGRNGDDIGANILYRYLNGVLTSQPLWDPSSGRFPHGALVAGVNDVPSESAFDVHQQLNVNTNDCPFPAGYGYK